MRFRSPVILAIFAAAACSVANSPEEVQPALVAASGGGSGELTDCADGHALCGDACVDIESDAAHCGSCGAACADGEVCAAGKCVSEAGGACAMGQTRCSGTCLDLQADAANCGACGNACSAPANSDVACNAGVCESSCQAGFGDCNGDPTDGCETDLNTTLEHCGACNAGCVAGENVDAAACAAGVCTVGACKTGFGDCDGDVLTGCERVLNFDDGHCSMCGMGCDTGAGQECVEGSCIVPVIRSNLLLCGTSQRDVTPFIPAGSGLTKIDSCAPDLDTQAMLVSRTGLASLTDDGALQNYVSAGGIIITEYNIGDEIYNKVFGEAVVQGTQRGSCTDRFPVQVQHSPYEHFWVDNPYDQLDTTVPSGCGMDIDAFPNLTLLSGYLAGHGSFGQRDLGDGRVYILEGDWQDGGTQPAQYTQSSMLMGWLITHRR
jgi:hypothetical protein